MTGRLWITEIMPQDCGSDFAHGGGVKYCSRCSGGDALNRGFETLEDGKRRFGVESDGRVKSNIAVYKIENLSRGTTEYLCLYCRMRVRLY